MPVKLIAPASKEKEPERERPPDPVPPKPPEQLPPEELNVYEKPFFPAKPVPYTPPKISPSSIPNPNPSIMSPKQVDGYPNYGSYLYSIPGYSAFQPITTVSSISYPVIVPNLNRTQSDPPVQTEEPKPEYGVGRFVPPLPMGSKETITTAAAEENSSNTDPLKDIEKSQTDFEEHFTPEIITPATLPDAVKMIGTESKMSITSISQGSGATVTIPSQIPNKEFNKKPERFSLITSIPISKIDLKCVSNPPDSAFQNSLARKSFNTAVTKETPRVEIQSNIVIKSAIKEPETKEVKPIVATNNSISTLINAAEAINKTDHQFRKPEPKVDTPMEVKDSPALPRPLFNPINIETSKTNLNKVPEPTYSEQKNQIVLIQNKNNSSSKMLLTIQQQNPQVLLQRSNFDSKNLQAPSRLMINQSKKCKEDIMTKSTSSNVVALKRLHQENCDENDFENLITENQIYGNKIVVKEKSQGTSQEQDLKNKTVMEKVTAAETKNVILQPNFVYLSNVQFPANLMMIKNNSKVTQTTECNKIKFAQKETKVVNEITTVPTVDSNSEIKNAKTSTTVNQEVHVLKSTNSLLQSLSKKTKPDIVIQANLNQQVIVNPQIVYQLPIPSIVESDKANQPIKKRDAPKFIAPNKPPKKIDPPKSNEKLYIACPYQMDAKLQPKIVITNIRPKINKIDEVSALDLYEKRKRMRRLKYLTNRENKDVKADVKKAEKTEICNVGVITPDKVNNEVYKEFANTKVNVDDDISGSESDDYGEEEMKAYEDIIEEYGTKAESERGKVEFMAHLRLATLQAFKEKDLELQDKILRNDSVASAYAAVGRLDVLLNVPPGDAADELEIDEDKLMDEILQENRTATMRKKLFLSKLRLTQVPQKYKEGYEKAWKEIIKERKRRNSNPDTNENSRLGFDPNCHLRILTEIKKSVNENNNLIKKRLDCNADSNDESIKVLTEKNFSELNRLSEMADTSVKLFKTPNARKRDLNPGFDSENIKKPSVRIEQPYQNYPKIKIPSVSKIISLKSTQECPSATTTQATSMDEPQNSAAGVTEMLVQRKSPGRTRDTSCQVEEASWPDVEALARSYKEYDAARRKEVADLHRRNTALKISGAHITCSASRDSDHARALLAERQNLSAEENKLRQSLHRLKKAIEFIRNY